MNAPLGKNWLISEIDNMIVELEDKTPVEFNEERRYLPQFVSPMPGYFRVNVVPFLEEIINCADIYEPVREVNLLKGVQIGYTTLLECIIMYFAGHIKTAAMMFLSAEVDLAKARFDENIIPMFNQSGMKDIFTSLDDGNRRKSGKTNKALQFKGGAKLTAFGATNANKMRTFSILLMLKDELDAWSQYIGEDGCPDELSDARCDAYSDDRKIFRGSTPTLKATSKIWKRFLQGDQRKYLVKCRHCGEDQYFSWSREYDELMDNWINGSDGNEGNDGNDVRSSKVWKEKDGILGEYGFAWELDEDGNLDRSSVHYRCKYCGGKHYDHDKRFMMAKENGAVWVATAIPVMPGIRSYHLPGYYSPFKPWADLVQMYIKSWDEKNKRPKDPAQYQVFVNNVLGLPFERKEEHLILDNVLPHRRACYRMGQIPNNYAREWSGSKIQFITCQVDIQKRFLAIAVMGWTRGNVCYLIDYKFDRVSDEDPDVTDLSCPVWSRLSDMIENKEWIADDGTVYGINSTFVDANGIFNDVACGFTGQYVHGVYPILGRTRPANNQRIKEFGKFETQDGQTGWLITVDHYKDRLASVLQRQWMEEQGRQEVYHFNAPIDCPEKHLKELTVEKRREKTDSKGRTITEWYRPGNARNEMWDLLVYGHCNVEVTAYRVCRERFELPTVDWNRFWDYVEEHPEEFQRWESVEG